MSVSPGDKFGPYTMISPLGEGGMGEVWKARDTRLDRTVALKLSKAAFTERFEREAHAVAALNHPNICTLHDVGPNYLVMELVEGAPLKGPLPTDKAVEYAAQILDALDAAHRKGIIHRDLKPANILVTKQGAKLLDFGLAKQATPLKETDATLTSALTGEGQILGTLQYMSPEQLQGKEADARSDIFAFGCVLYEMLTGKRAFEGPSAASVIAAIIERPAPSLGAEIPPALERVVKRCLAKDPDDRWQTARDLRAELLWIAGAGGPTDVPVSQHRRRERLPWLVAGAVSALFLALLIFTLVRTREQPNTAAQVRFQIPTPDKLTFRVYDLPAISPDGERIAFTAGDSDLRSTRLFIRPLNLPAPTLLSVPEAPIFPFWSPDGRQIAFATLTTLQKVDVAGGPPTTLCQCAARGGTWSRDGVIVVSLNGLLHRLPASGGEPKPLGSLAKGEVFQAWPQFLPDGRHYVYLSKRSQPDQQGIYVGSLDGSDRKFILAAETNAVYGLSGQLLFMRGNALMAQPFDLRSLQLRDEPRPVADHITTSTGNLAATFAASLNGVLVWRTGGATGFRLQWFDRNGKKLGVVGDPADYSSPVLSPDEKKLAVGIVDSQTKTRDIWVIDLVRGTKSRLTFDPADDLNPVWSPDGKWIAFTSERKGERDIYRKLADGSGPEELLLESKDGQKNLEDWSPDGKYLLYNHQPPRSHHLYALPVEGDRKPIPFLKTAFQTESGQFSPNGRWLSYRSNESGTVEIYVQGFNLDPSQPRGKWQVSTAGGSEAQWRRDGKELFYFSNKSLMAVDVKTDSASFEAGIPKPLFEVLTSSNSRNHFAASRDGQRFLFVTPVEESGGQPLQVLVNWR